MRRPVPMWDTTHDHLPITTDTQMAGYTTGGKGIRWTAADWKAHAGAVRICQDAGASDATADVLDVESGAASIADVPGWVARAREAFDSAARPGQRTPCVYLSAAEVPELVTYMRQHAPDTDVSLWVAHWGVGRIHAEAQLLVSRAPFRTVAFQYARGDVYDLSVAASDWLEDVSAPDRVKPAPAAAPTMEAIVAQLPQLKQGDTGKAVRTAQGLLVARYHDLGTTGRAHDGIDGDYGPVTAAAVRAAQKSAGLAEDGVTGPLTWPVLAGA